MKAKDAAEKIFRSFRLSSEDKLEIKVDQAKGYIKWGKKNDFPSYLLDLFNGHAEHGAIVKGKARYLKGLSIKSTTPAGEVFLQSANKKETWHKLSGKLNLDKVLFGGFAIKVLPNVLGTPLEFYHLDFGKIRISSDQTKVLYSDDWSDHWSEKIEYPIYYPGCKVASVYLFRNYNPTLKKIEAAYPLQEYGSCLLDIDTDKRASNFFNSLIRNNFSAGTLITIFDKADAKQKEYIVEQLKGETAGDEQAGNILVTFVAPGGKGAEVATLNANDLDKQYQEVSKRSQQKIIMGHNVPPILFKLKTEGQLGERNEIDMAHELFLNEYVKPEQGPFLETIKYFYSQKTKQQEEFEIEQFALVGKELPLDNQAVVDMINGIDPTIVPKYLSEKFGFPLPKATQPPGPDNDEIKTNEHLKNLTGRQLQGLKRYAREYRKGDLTFDQAAALLKSSFGLTDEQIKMFLVKDEGVYMNIQAASQKKEDLFFALFEKYAHDINNDDEVLEVTLSKPKVITINSRFKLAQPLKVSVTDLRNAILNQLKGNPQLSPDELAELLQVEVGTIQSEIEWLSEKKLINDSGDGWFPTKKGFNKNSEPLETEIYTEYTYELAPGVSGPPVKDTTRELCGDLYYKTRSEALTFEAIEKMDNEFGESVWDYRGGFWNDGTEVKPWCRHIWEGKTKIRRK